MKRSKKILFVGLLSVLGLCLVLVGGLFVTNRRLPQRSAVLETLSYADKIRLEEYLSVRRQLGDAVFPGWGQADIPAILYNEEYAFLVGYPDPPGGWVKVPAGIERGTAWEIVPGDSFMGQPYYRQRLPDPEVTPEAFTVLVGDRWVSSMPTLDWFRIGLVDTIRADLPGFVRPIFPYQLLVGQLVSGSDQYISLAAHESFHSYQGMMASQKFAESELINRYEGEYSSANELMRADWQTELDLLAEALQSAGRAETLDLAHQFLEARAARRQSAGLPPDLLAYEQNREWLEGLARYVELEIWRQAADGDYVPLSTAGSLPDFDEYQGFGQRWMGELGQLTRMAGDEGDGRFYYSGMAQAVLLDRLMPGWKLRVLDENVWLEDLLWEAVRAS